MPYWKRRPEAKTSPRHYSSAGAVIGKEENEENQPETEAAASSILASSPF